MTSRRTGGIHWSYPVDAAAATASGRRRRHGDVKSAHKGPRKRPLADDGATGERPRQRRRTSIRQSGSITAGLVLTALPLEVLYEIALWLNPTDMGRLGMSCRTLAHVVDDERLWRGAFVRLYGRALYEGTAAGVMARHVAARDAGRSHPAAIVPPMPFLYMELARRGWRWLCSVHHPSRAKPQENPVCDNGNTSSSSLSSSLLSSSSPAQGQQQCQETVPAASRYDGTIESCDKRFAYGVEIKRDTCGAISEWIEAVWDRSVAPNRPAVVLSHGNAGRWFAIEAAAAASILNAQEDPAPEVAHRGRVVACVKGTVYEGACRRGVAHGVGIVTDADGRQWEAVSYDGLTLSTTWKPCDGRVESLAVRRVIDHRSALSIDQAAAWTHQLHHQLQGQQQQQEPDQRQGPRGHRPRAPVALNVRYANGDRLHLFHAAHTNSVAFWCSPNCADPRFAGRRIECRTWAHTLDVGALAVWPLDDSTDPDSDAQAFIDYVGAGHCGWTETAQAHARQMAALGAAALLSARSALSPLPYGIVQSDEAQMAVARRFFEAYA
ncbi:F-box domain containing protein [Pandoravirus macleodensis]|uniref:F-box domain containing protein n=1 Tax=Pandoravirus macleodensis TaxID=2107707 RepID=A0A2U7UGV0_9VIRU|nr:F-box domain containing protein [Pandoravirus macleodensis]AVK77261.1 F-box domain containing protein [Pandoravirus macleodensis]